MITYKLSVRIRRGHEWGGEEGHSHSAGENEAGYDGVWEQERRITHFL